MIKGDSFDLRTGFDLSDPAVQQRVSRRLVETNAVLAILRPPCTKCSTLQALNLHINGSEWAAAFAVEKEKAVAHIEYSMKLAKLQRSRGAYFLFEHPALDLVGVAMHRRSEEDGRRRYGGWRHVHVWAHHPE